MKFLAGLLGPAIDDDEDDDQDTAPRGLLSSPVVRQAPATGLLGYDGSANEPGPDNPRDVNAALPVPFFDPLATLQGIVGPSYFTDTNADMQERQRDRLMAAPGGVPDAPTLSLSDDELARENYLLRDKAAMQNPPAQPPTLADLERQYKRDNVSPAVPQFGTDARSEEVSKTSLEVLNRIALEAGIDIGKLKVSSTKRTPAEQAQIMYDQLVLDDTSQYGKYGQQLIDIFKAGQRAGESPRVTRDKMAQRAQELMDQGHMVSNHFGDPLEMNVFDIAPSSVPAGKAQAFQGALQTAKARGDLHDFHSRYTRPRDPAFHLEIDQPTSQANVNTVRQNQLFRQWENQHPYAPER